MLHRARLKDPLWTKQQFEQASTKLNEIQTKLAKLRPRLTFKISEGRSEMFTHYLFSSAST
jgi:hypothetical protein